MLDFEATCEDPNPPDYVHEIIEFPVVLLNLKTLKVVSKIDLQFGIYFLIVKFFGGCLAFSTQI